MDGGGGVSEALYHLLAVSVDAVAGFSIFRFDLHPELMAQAQPGFRLHALVVMSLFALWPFTRLVHVLTPWAT